MNPTSVNAVPTTWESSESTYNWGEYNVYITALSSDEIQIAAESPKTPFETTCGIGNRLIETYRRKQSPS